MCLLGMSEASFIEVHQHDFLNMRRTRATPMNIPKWSGLQGKVCEASLLHKELQASKEC